jgi:hypothetical protein
MNYSISFKTYWFCRRRTGQTKRPGKRNEFERAEKSAQAQRTIDEISHHRPAGARAHLIGHHGTASFLDRKMILMGFCLLLTLGCRGISSSLLKQTSRVKRLHHLHLI